MIGVRDVAQRVVGDFAAQGQVAARHLVDDRQQFRDAALQRVVRFLVARGLEHFSHGAVQIVGDVAELIGRR